MGSRLQEYFFFRSGPDIHMVMNQRVRADGKLPSELAWVTPLPAMPTKYFEEKDSLFGHLHAATEPPAKRSMEMPKEKGFAVHATVHVGKYEIKPVEVLDTASGEAINDWLHGNGYHRVPLAGLRYYLKPKACFLAIKVRGLKGREAALRPLHVVFQAKEVRVPLKFFANAGTFDVFVYMKTKTPSGEYSQQQDLVNRGFQWEGARQAERQFIDRLGVKGLSPDSSRIYRFFGAQINSGSERVEKWESDPLVELE